MVNYALFNLIHCGFVCDLGFCKQDSTTDANMYKSLQNHAFSQKERENHSWVGLC